MAEPGKFLVENKPVGDELNWAEALEGREPTMDANGYLNGIWGQCMMAAIRYERTHRPRWDREEGYEDDGPCGMVIQYLEAQGLPDTFVTAADALEELTKQQYSEIGHLDVEDDHNPEVWKDGPNRPAWEPEGFHEEVAKLFHDDTCWCCVSPLTCGGFGCAGPCEHSIYLKAWKCCCVEGSAFTEDCCTEEGACFKFEKLCCIVSHYGCPPGGGNADGVPYCACCNQRCGGEDEHPDESKFIINDNGKLMGNAFLCIYCLCIGGGCTHPCDPMYRSTTKCLCINSEIGTADCCPDRGCCYSYSKECCCICALAPPCVGGGKHDGIPSCAFMGYKCGEDELGAPKQESMDR